jgi:hypothetical protein
MPSRVSDEGDSIHLLQPVAPLDDLLPYVADEGSQN